MALRVLLADESTTIKKVMQLALQDFAVEVKSVHTGVDVAEVARAFIPDIIFADVLLQKKNGYEVCAELKRDPALKTTPIVLMWSSFMDLDEKQAALSLADRKLEKPFDVEHLRQLVMELVPKTRSQRLAHFLQFPDSIVEPMREEIEQKAPQTPPPLPPREPATAAPTVPPPSAEALKENKEGEEEVSSWNMESFEDISAFSQSDLEIETDDEGDSESFSELRIVPPALARDNLNEASDVSSEIALMPESEEKSSEDESDPWSHQDLSRFKLDLESVEETASSEEVELSVEFEEPTPAKAKEPFDLIRPTAAKPASEPPSAVELELNNLKTEEADTIDFSTPTAKISAAKGGIPTLDADQLEKIVRAQSREIIETLVRRIVPDLATKIIRAELERLLEEPGPE